MENNAHPPEKFYFGACGPSFIVPGVNINIPRHYYEPKQHISGSVLHNYIGVGNLPMSSSEPRIGLAGARKLWEWNLQGRQLEYALFTC